MVITGYVWGDLLEPYAGASSPLAAEARAMVRAGDPRRAYPPGGWRPRDSIARRGSLASATVCRSGIVASRHGQDHPLNEVSPSPLKTNVAEVPRILPIHACVTGAPQSTVRFTADQAAWGNRIATDDHGVLVPAITIEELCRQNGIEKIDLLKLDIEGAEEQVLKNGAFLARTEHIIVELHGHYGFQCFQRDIAPCLMDWWRRKGDHQTPIW